VYVLRHRVEYVPSDSDALDNAVVHQWTHNHVLVPTPSAVATRHRNHHRRVEHLHSTFRCTLRLMLHLHKRLADYAVAERAAITECSTDEIGGNFDQSN